MRHLPGCTGRDLNLGTYRDECHAAIAVDLFIAMYCIEYPQYLEPMSSLFNSCSPQTIEELLNDFPYIAV